jgi:orotate phosphoribosyltransferase-like protein
MDFKEFTDRLLAANVTAQTIADELGVSRNTVLRARMDVSSPNARSAPTGWQDKLRRLAADRAGELERLSHEAR